MNEKNIKLPSEELLACFTDVEQEYYSELDLNRPIKLIGCYYYGNDVQKVHAKFKDGCTFIGDPSLNLIVTNILIKSEQAIDVGRHIQSLHTDSNGEDMLTSWIDIDDLICSIGMSASIDTLKLLLELNNWKEQGVQEIHISWYEKTITVIAPDNLYDLNKTNPNIRSGVSIFNQQSKVDQTIEMLQQQPRKALQSADPYWQEMVKQKETRQPTFVCHFENDDNIFAIIFVKKHDDYTSFNEIDKKVAIDQINHFNILHGRIVDKELKYLSNEYLGSFTISEQHDKALEYQKIMKLDDGSLNLLKGIRQFVEIAQEQLQKPYFYKPVIFIFKLIGSIAVNLDINEE